MLNTYKDFEATMRYLIFFLIVIGTSLLVYANDTQQPLVNQVHSYFEQNLSRLSARDIEWGIIDVARSTPEILEPLKARVDEDIQHCKQMIGKRDVGAIKAGAAFLAVTAFCCWAMYLVHKKVLVPHKQKIEELCAPYGVRKISWIEGDYQSIYCEREVGPYYRRISSDDEIQLQQLIKGYAHRKGLMGACFAAGFASGIFGWAQLAAGLHPGYKESYDKWCRVKLAIEHALKK